MALPVIFEILLLLKITPPLFLMLLPLLITFPSFNITLLLINVTPLLIVNVIVLPQISIPGIKVLSRYNHCSVQTLPTVLIALTLGSVPVKLLQNIVLLLVIPVVESLELLVIDPLVGPFWLHKIKP